MNTRPLFSLLLFALVALVRPAMGIVVIDSDDSENLAPPPDGSPWNYVARLNDHFGARASGVYLGSGYILTADHVDHDMNLVHLNNVDYAVDTTFTPVALQGTDMRILRMVGDPGLPRLPLINPWESELNRPCTMMGYGVGKGTVVPNQGWNWADDTTRLERWATNTTLGAYYNDPVTLIVYVETTFDRTVGPREGQLSGGDSGGALFVNIDGVWKLVAIGNGIDADDQALYDMDPATPGDQPDHSYFAAVKPVASQILAFVPDTNEPIALHMVVVGGNVQLYWPASATGWALYATGNFRAPNWAPVTATPVVTAGFNMVTLPLTGASQFYQLRQSG